MLPALISEVGKPEKARTRARIATMALVTLKREHQKREMFAIFEEKCRAMCLGSD